MADPAETPPVETPPTPDPAPDPSIDWSAPIGDGAPPIFSKYKTLSDAAEGARNLQSAWTKSQEEKKALEAKVAEFERSAAETPPTPPAPDGPSPEAQEKLAAALGIYYQRQAVPEPMLKDLAKDHNLTEDQVLNLMDARYGQRQAFNQTLSGIDEEVSADALEAWVKSGNSNYSQNQLALMEKWAEEGKVGFATDLVGDFKRFVAGGGVVHDPATGKYYGAPPPERTGRPPVADAPGFKSGKEYFEAREEARKSELAGNPAVMDAVRKKLAETPPQIQEQIRMGVMG